MSWIVFLKWILLKATISLYIGGKYKDLLHVGVPMAERIGPKAGQPSITFLWTFARP